MDDAAVANRGDIVNLPAPIGQSGGRRGVNLRGAYTSGDRSRADGASLRSGAKNIPQGHARCREDPGSFIGDERTGEIFIKMI